MSHQLVGQITPCRETGTTLRYLLTHNIESFSRLKSSLPFLLCCKTDGGGVATFMAKPYAPRNEWLSLTMKAPGSFSFRTAMAIHTVQVKISMFGTRGLKEQVPWSLEIPGLYQNFEVSCTNFTASVLLPKSSGKIKCLMLWSNVIRAYS